MGGYVVGDVSSPLLPLIFGAPGPQAGPTAKASQEEWIQITWLLLLFLICRDRNGVLSGSWGGGARDTSRPCREG